MPEREPTMLERHFQTGIQVILVALLIWAGAQLVQLGQQSVVLEERLTSQGMLLNEMRAELRDWGELYYRRSEARRDLDNIESRIDSLDSRVTALEGRR